MKNRKIYYAVLNMGLGHAARSLPLIQHLNRQGCEVRVGSNGRALEFLRRELPDIQFISTPDYGISYSSNTHLLPKLALQIPRVLNRIVREHRVTQNIVQSFRPDLIISDHCYGAFHSETPGIFLSHQIYFALPLFLRPFSPLVNRFNFFFHSKFDRVVIPDIETSEGGLLSGKLSRKSATGTYSYIGILSSLRRQNGEPAIDYLVSISGPEPQRTILEHKLLAQIEGLKGKKVVLLGKSETSQVVRETKDLLIYTHLPREKMERLYNLARIVIGRPGYTTLMEMAELGKRGLFIPTPGQTEQNYLANHVRQKQWFYCVPQHLLNLSRDCKIAQTFSGIYLENGTQQTLKAFQKVVDAVLNESACRTT